MLVRKLLVMFLCVALSPAGCGDDDGGGMTDDDDDDDDGDDDDDDDDDGNATRGGLIYDKFWVVVEADEPDEDHPYWADRPDQESNAAEGSGTWRCKECHGWDYKGVDGVYGDGSHKTGFDGVLGSDLSLAELVTAIGEDHGYSDAGMDDEDVLDVATFIADGLADVDDFIEDGAFNGDAEAGEAHFNPACSSCHGEDGLSDEPTGSEGGFEDFPGLIANENPWEFLHKVRFGQPGTLMPAQAEELSDSELSDLGAYAQTLPESAR